MTFRTNDVQTTRCQNIFMVFFPLCLQTCFIFRGWVFNFRQLGFPVTTKQDVRTTTRHVGGNGHRIWTTRLCNNIRLALMLFGVQYFMVNPSLQQFGRQDFTGLNGGCTNQDWRNTLLTDIGDFLNNGTVFAITV